MFSHPHHHYIHAHHPQCQILYDCTNLNTLCTKMWNCVSFFCLTLKFFLLYPTIDIVLFVGRIFFLQKNWTFLSFCYRVENVDVCFVSSRVMKSRVDIVIYEPGKLTPPFLITPSRFRFEKKMDNISFGWCTPTTYLVGYVIQKRYYLW